MKNCIVIRAVSIDKPTVELRSYLESYFRKSVYIALDCFANDEIDVDVDGNIIKVGKKFLNSNGLRYFPRAGWQCGDYIYYAVSYALEDFSHIWMIEPDVRITLPPAEFFERCEAIPDDLLGVTLGERRENWGWYRSIHGFYDEKKVYGMYFPISRLSRGAIRFLMEKRAEYCASNRVAGLDFKSSGLIRLFANDEAFVATTVRTHGLSSRTLQSICGDAFSGYFTTEVPVLEAEVDHPSMIGKVIHPVCDFERARKKIAIYRSKYSSSAVLLTREREVRERLGAAICNAVFGIKAG